MSEEPALKKTTRQQLISYSAGFLCSLYMGCIPLAISIVMFAPQAVAGAVAYAASAGLPVLVLAGIPLQLRFRYTKAAIWTQAWISVVLGGLVFGFGQLWEALTPTTIHLPGIVLFSSVSVTFFSVVCARALDKKRTSTSLAILVGSALVVAIGILQFVRFLFPTG
jgi:hypothetical protein